MILDRSFARLALVFSSALAWACAGAASTAGVSSVGVGCSEPCETTGGASGDATAADTGTDESGPACQDGLSECDGECVDLDQDPAHCGACNAPCAASEVCSLAECSAECGAPTVPCDGLCIDPTSDPQHCGGCNQPCAADESCDDGTCIPAAVDPCANDPCNGHGWCEGGVCSCDPGYDGADCTACSGTWQLAGTQCLPVVVIEGTSADDTLDGDATLAVDELIRGLDGNDTVRGLDGTDYVNGNGGDDTLNGNQARDEVRGGSGNDLVQGGSEDDTVWGDEGIDELVGGAGDDRMIGGEGDDIVRGEADDDRYVIDGLGHDVFDDSSGIDAARCAPGVMVLDDAMDGADRVLSLSTGGSVRIVDNQVESVLGCQ